MSFVISEELKNNTETILRDCVKNNVSERTYINILSGEFFTSFLADNNIDVSDIAHIYSIPKMIEKFDISDVILPNAHIDVRIVWDEKIIFVPKSHFDYNIVPDIYVVLKLDKNLETFDILGYFTSDKIDKKFQNSDYYFVPKSKLVSADNLVEFIKNYKNSKANETEEMIDRGDLLFMDLLDNSIDMNSTKELLSLMISSNTLRQNAKDFEAFNSVAYNVGLMMREIETNDLYETNDFEDNSDFKDQTGEENSNEDESEFNGGFFEEEDDSGMSDSLLEDDVDSDFVSQPEDETSEAENDEIIIYEDEDKSNVAGEIATTALSAGAAGIVAAAAGAAGAFAGEVAGELASDAVGANLGNTLNAAELVSDAAMEFVSGIGGAETQVEKNIETEETENNFVNSEDMNISEEISEEPSIEEYEHPEEFQDIKDDAQDVNLESFDDISNENNEVISGFEQEEEQNLTDFSDLPTQDNFNSTANSTEENYDENLPTLDEIEAQHLGHPEVYAFIPHNDQEHLTSMAEFEESNEFENQLNVQEQPNIETVDSAEEVENISDNEVADDSDFEIIEADNEQDFPTQSVEEMSDTLNELDNEIEDSLDFAQEEEPTAQDEGLETLNFDQEEEPTVQDEGLETLDFAQEEEQTAQDEGLETLGFDQEEPTAQDEGLETLDFDQEEEPTAQDEGLETLDFNQEEEPTVQDEGLETLDFNQEEELTVQDEGLETLGFAQEEPTAQDEGLETLGFDQEEPAAQDEQVQEDLANSELELDLMGETITDDFEENADDPTFEFIDPIQQEPEESNSEDISQTDETVENKEEQGSGAISFIDEEISNGVSQPEEADTFNFNSEEPIKEENSQENSGLEFIETETKDNNEGFSFIGEESTPDNQNQSNNTEQESANAQDGLSFLEPLAEIGAGAAVAGTTIAGTAGMAGVVSEAGVVEGLEAIAEPISAEVKTDVTENATETIDNNANEEVKYVEISTDLPVQENSTIISSANFVPGEIHIDINKIPEEEIPKEFGELKDLYDNDSKIPGQNLLNNSGRSLKTGAGIIGIIISLIIIGIVGFSVSKIINKPQNPDNDNLSVPEGRSPEEGAEKLENMPNQDNIIKMNKNSSIGAVPAEDQGAQMPATAFIDVKKLTWEVPDYISYDENFKSYFQSSGKSLKLALSSDLLLAKSYAYTDVIKVTINFEKTGDFANAEILQSSGSPDIDKIVLRTVKQTLKVLKAPPSIGNDDNTTVILKIYL